MACALVGCGQTGLSDIAKQSPDSSKIAADAQVTRVAKPNSLLIKEDFNGDGKSDLLIVDESGSYEYLATGDGQFQGNVWVRTDLTIANTRYVTGDFNGDGMTDLLIVDASGSYEYLATGNGQFQANVWVRTDLTTANAQYFHRGDFTMTA